MEYNKNTKFIDNYIVLPIHVCRREILPDSDF